MMRKPQSEPRPRSERDSLEWVESCARDLHTTADLEASFAALETSRHFYAEALRGRILSLKVRGRTACPHFERALTLSTWAPATPGNLACRLLLDAYITENSLLRAARRRNPFGMLPTLIPQDPTRPPDRSRADLSRFAGAEWLRACGLYHLHLAHGREAKRNLDAVIKKRGSALGSSRVGARLGLAAVMQNLAYPDSARNHLESAGRELRDLESLLDRAHYSATLGAIWRLLFDQEKALSWDAYFESLPCPEATLAVFRRRRELILERSQDLAFVLVF